MNIYVMVANSIHKETSQTKVALHIVHADTQEEAEAFIRGENQDEVILNLSYQEIDAQMLARAGYYPLTTFSDLKAGDKFIFVGDSEVFTFPRCPSSQDDADVLILTKL
jgi:hypothetical protein